MPWVIINDKVVQYLILFLKTQNITPIIEVANNCKILPYIKWNKPNNTEVTIMVIISFPKMDSAL